MDSLSGGHHKSFDAKCGRRIRSRRRIADLSHLGKPLYFGCYRDLWSVPGRKLWVRPHSIISLPSIKKNQILFLPGFVVWFGVNSIMIEPRFRHPTLVVNDMKFGGAPRFFFKLLDDQFNTRAVMKKPPVRDTVFRPKLIEKRMNLVSPPSKNLI